MIKQMFLIVATFAVLSFCSCTNDTAEEITANEKTVNVSDTSSNIEAESIKLKSGFTVTKENGVYSMGDILLSEEQVHLLDETGSFFTNPAGGINIKRQR